MGATAQGEGLRGRRGPEAPPGGTGRLGGAAVRCPLQSLFNQGPPACSTRWTGDRQPAYSLLRGQHCRASCIGPGSLGPRSHAWRCWPSRASPQHLGAGRGRRSPRVGAWLP